MKLVDGVLGVLELVPKAVTSEIAAYGPGVAPDAKVEELLTARKDARAKKDFAASDRIRDELAAMGYAIKDMAGGRVEVRRA
jgi:cysteinyl-tRNA synthetase